MNLYVHFNDNNIYSANETRINSLFKKNKMFELT